MTLSLLIFYSVKHGHDGQRPMFKLILRHEKQSLREDRFDDLCAHPLRNSVVKELLRNL